MCRLDRFDGFEDVRSAVMTVSSRRSIERAKLTWVGFDPDHGIGTRSTQKVPDPVLSDGSRPRPTMVPAWSAEYLAGPVDQPVDLVAPAVVGLLADQELGVVTERNAAPGGRFRRSDMVSG